MAPRQEQSLPCGDGGEPENQCEENRKSVPDREAKPAPGAHDVDEGNVARGEELDIDIHPCFSGVLQTCASRNTGKNRWVTTAEKMASKRVPAPLVVRVLETPR